MISKLFEQKLKRDLLRIAVLTVITVLIWIGLTTYWAFKKSQIKPEVQRQLVPLTPSLDLDTMENIKQRQPVTAQDWKSLGLEPEKPQIIQLPETEAATGGAELAAPEATSSAE
jgi:hypothetical protein